jgi:hypothetical protein
MIRNERDYSRSLRDLEVTHQMTWALYKNKDRDAGLYQRWSHRQQQLEFRLQQYEKSQPRGWRGGRDNARYLAEVKKMILGRPNMLIDN